MTLSIHFQAGSGTAGAESRLREFRYQKQELIRRREELELLEEAVDSAIDDLEKALRNYRNE